MGKDVQINARIDPETRRRFKKFCIDAHTSMTELLNLFISEVLSGHLIYTPNADQPFRGDKENTDARPD